MKKKLGFILFCSALVCTQAGLAMQERDRRLVKYVRAEAPKLVVPVIYGVVTAAVTAGAGKDPAQSVGLGVAMTALIRFLEGGVFPEA